MSKPKIGAVTIGQSPRPDLVEPLVKLRPDVEIIEVGALDGLTAAELPDAAEASYPLKTRLREGRLVTVPETFLKPLIQQAVEAAEGQGGLATVLLCAGTFAEVRGVSRPLIKPFDTAVAVLNSMGVTHLGVLSPMMTQERPIQARWTAANFDARVWTPPYAIDSKEFTGWLYRMMSNTRSLDAIVLDYVGHPANYKLVVQEILGIPVVDLGHLALSVTATMV